MLAIWQAVQTEAATSPPQRGRTIAAAVPDESDDAADDQLADSGLGSGATQVRVISWILNKRHDPRCQSFCCGGFIDSHIGADFGEARGPEETR